MSAPFSEELKQWLSQPLDALLAACKCGPQFTHRAAIDRMPEIGRELGDRRQNKSILQNIGARHLHTRLVEHLPTVQQQIKIECTRRKGFG